jgi:uncharacterized membrane protein YuzA (DUF378 family)
VLKLKRKIIMRKLDQVVMALLILGGITWGLWGLFQFDLIGYIFKEEWINRLFYIIFGFCGVYYFIGWKNVEERRKKR